MTDYDCLKQLARSLGLQKAKPYDHQRLKPNQWCLRSFMNPDAPNARKCKGKRKHDIRYELGHFVDISFGDGDEGACLTVTFDRAGNALEHAIFDDLRLPGSFYEKESTETP